MMQIKENGAILCLPEKTEQPLFTVCCIGGEQLAGELAAIEKLLPADRAADLSGRKLGRALPTQCPAPSGW